jgi:outer membrane receptor for ferrienterochelin and colicins
VTNAHKQVFFRFHLALLIGWAWASVSFAQAPLVNVLDSEGLPLYGAHLSFSKDSSVAPVYRVTNAKGQTEIPLALPCKVEVRYLGMQPKSLILKGDGPFVVELQADAVFAPEYVVTAHSTPTRMEETVYQARVIDRKRIDAQGAQNLRDLLSNDLNFRLSQDAVLGSSVQMMGVGGENIKLMIDGVPVIGRLDGNIDLSQINLQNIERVEIIEGPMSVLYGSNALGGVINLITKKNQAHQWEGHTTLFYETVGNYNADARVAWQKGRHQASLSGGRYFFDGFSSSDSIRRVQTWKPKEQYFADAAYGLSIKKLNLRYQGQYYRETMQFKGSPEMPFGIAATDQYFYTDRIGNSLFLNGFLKERHHLDITAAYNYFFREREVLRKDLVSLDETPVETSTDRFDLWMSRGIYTWQMDTAKLTLQAGYEVNYETGQGPRILNQEQNQLDLAGFVALEYRPHRKLSLKPGIRYGYNSSFEAIPIPSFHARLQAMKHLTLRASYARGFRAPSLKELFFEFVDVNHNIYGNPALLPEASHNAQLGLSFDKPLNKNLRLSAEANGFYNYIDNQIRLTLVNVTDDSLVYRNENISYFRSLGTRVQSSLQWKGLQLQAGWSYTGVENGLQDIPEDQNRLAFFHEGRLNLGYDLRSYRTSFQLFFKYTGRQPFLYSSFDESLQTSVVQEGYIDGFANMDASLTQRFLKNRVTVTFLARNLMNITDVRQTAGASGGAHSSGSNALPTLWGRSFAVSLRYQFLAGKK